MQQIKNNYDWDGGGAPEAPTAPENLQQTGLTIGFISDELFNAVGPAIVSGKSVFIYGPPGNGKTAITQAIGSFMNSSGGEIYVPFAFMAENNVITIFDKSVHETADGDGDERTEDNE